jgi:LPS sulfotransferase NodH
MTANFEFGPIFLVGVPRSGTTLLQRILDAHPDVAIAPETFFVRRFAERRKHYGKLDDPRHRGKLLDDLVATPEFAEMGLDAREFRATIDARAKRALEYHDVFAEWLDAYRVRRGKRIVGEKTPNHLLAMRRLEEWFPNARFVHIVRDPRAVTESWRNVPWTNGSLEADAEVWRRYLATARREPPLRAPLHEVRYEALIADPEAATRELCRAIGIEFAPAMVHFHATEADALNVEREPWKADALKPVQRDAVERWRTRLEADEIAAIEAVVWFEMRRLRYSAATPLLKLAPAALRQAALRRRKEREKRIRKGTE